jgi:YD repeat-containing protein
MKTILTLVLLALLPSAALAQQSTIYGPDGKVTGRVATDSQGSTTIYDAAGRVTGRTSTDSQGTTTIYDASGRKAGSVTGKSPATK